MRANTADFDNGQLEGDGGTKGDKKPNESFLVFVYGTLKAGQSNHSHHLTGATFVGKAVTANPYDMRDNGGFPVVFPSGDKPVSGEVYEIGATHLAGLDRLEGHPRFFRREEVQVKVDDPIPLGDKTCWMYFGVPKAWQHSIDALPRATVVKDVYNWSRA